MNATSCIGSGEQKKRQAAVPVASFIYVPDPPLRISNAPLDVSVLIAWLASLTFIDIYMNSMCAHATDKHRYHIGFGSAALYTATMTHPSRDNAGETAAQPLISLAQAADLSGLSPGHLRLLVSQGKLWGVKIGRNWVTTAAAVNDYLASDRRPGPNSNR